MVDTKSIKQVSDSNLSQAVYHWALFNLEASQRVFMLLHSCMVLIAQMRLDILGDLVIFLLEEVLLSSAQMVGPHSGSNTRDWIATRGMEVTPSILIRSLMLCHCRNAKRLARQTTRARES